MGKNKYIETPEKMWELFEAYKKDVKSKPRYIFDYVGKDGQEVQKPLERPLTMSGFYNYCYDTVGCAEQYFVNQGGLYDDYISICSRIKRVVRQDQIEGGMVGQYNSSITQRLNGLTDKKEINHKEEPRIFNV